MICQVCQQAKAAVHTLDLQGGQWVQRHYCQKCALGGSQEAASDAGKVIKFFGQILAQAGKSPSELLQQITAAEATGGECRGCGMSYEQFQHARRLGCARCYEEFAHDLEQIFLRVQEEAAHRGKTPGRPRGSMPSPMELRRLREHLQRAVEEERFEEAARFRDQITKLSKDLEEGRPQS